MTFASWYKSFSELSKSEREGVSYQRKFANRQSRFAIIAPHGGGIEPGTSEITKAIAGTQFSYYTFDGIRQEGNELLHITSTLFDEPKCLKMVSDSEVVVAIHGCAGSEEFVYLGGLHDEVKTVLFTELVRVGFDARMTESAYAGTQLQNICNRGQSGRGVQLEISEGLRRAMFKKLSRPGRKITTDVFQKFVNSVRSAIISFGLRRSI